MSRKRGVGENAANGEAPVMPNSNAAKMRVVRQKIAHNPLSTTVIAVATPKKRSRSSGGNFSAEDKDFIHRLIRNRKLTTDKVPSKTIISNIMKAWATRTLGNSRKDRGDLLTEDRLLDFIRNPPEKWPPEWVQAVTA